MGNNSIDIRKKDSSPYLIPSNKSNLSYKDLKPILIVHDINNPSFNHLVEEKKDINQERLSKDDLTFNYPKNKIEEYTIYNFIREKLTFNQNTNSSTRIKKIKYINKKPANDKKQNLFIITTEKKDENEFTNKGRRKKDKLYPNESVKKLVHDKFQDDNIIQKIKIHFLNAALQYVNSEYKKYFQKMYPRAKYQELIKMMERNYEKYLNNENKKTFLLLKLSDILSGKVSNRYSNEGDKEHYNKKNIEKLMEEGEPKHLVDFINKTVEDAYEIYIREEADKIPEFNIENDLSKIQDEKNEKGESYKAKYKIIAKEFLKIINNK